MHEDDAWNVPHPDDARDGYPPEYWGGDRASLDAGHPMVAGRDHYGGEHYGGDYYGERDDYYGQAPSWAQGARSRFGGRQYEYSHVPEPTGYDPGAYR